MDCAVSAARYVFALSSRLGLERIGFQDSSNVSNVGFCETWGCTRIAVHLARSKLIPRCVFSL